VALTSFVRRGGALIALTLAAGALSLGAASPASAGLGIACPDATTKAFAQFDDPANYAFVPNGGFESGASGWTLSGGASVISGNETYYLHGAADRYSLRLPAGAKATTPPMCIGLASGHMRFVVGGAAGASVKVQVIYRGLLSSVLGILDGTGTVASDGTWQPSDEVSMFFGGTLPLLTQSVQFRFTSVDGAVQIDDVYLDPFLHV